MRGEFVLAAALAAAALAGCTVEQHNRVYSGDANSVEILYSGDRNATIPLARQYCAQYEKVPDPISVNDDKIIYACVAPGTPSRSEQHA
jgi:hypothetical protein